MKEITALVVAFLLSSATFAAEFEYQILVFDKFAKVRDITNKLNYAGERGWELVSTDQHIINGSMVTYRYHLKKRK